MRARPTKNQLLSGKRDKFKVQQSMDRCLAVLESFVATQDGQQTISAISDATGLPQPTVSRYVNSLTNDGYLARSHSKQKYRLGAGVLALGYASHRFLKMGNSREEALQCIADTYGVHIGVFEREYTDMVCIQSIHSRTRLQTLQIELGFKRPIHTLACGHALLASLTEAECQYLISLIEASHQNNRLTNQAMNRSRSQYDELGFVEFSPESCNDLLSTAVPIKSIGGARSSALMCSYQKGQLTKLSQNSLVHAMKKLVSQLSQ